MSRSVCVCLLLVLLLLALAPAVAGEGRTPLYDRTLIVNPGKYIVTRNIEPLICGISVIEVAASDVDIDLNGFRIKACDGATVIHAIGQNNITVRNGTLLAQEGSYGIWLEGQDNSGSHKVVIEDVKILYPANDGIRLDKITDFALRRNNVFGAGGAGIVIDGKLGNTDLPEVEGTIEANQIESGNGGITVIEGSSVAILNNRLERLSAAAGPAAIVYDLSEGGLISNNTIQLIFEGSGISLGDSSGCKIYNNVVRTTDVHGIVLGGFSNDNLVLNNVVSDVHLDGLLVDGSGNHLDRNLLNNNGQWGMHISPPGADNTFGRNTARRNLGAPPTCAWGGVGYPPTTDFCDEGINSGSFNDNYMPNFF